MDARLAFLSRGVAALSIGFAGDTADALEAALDGQSISMPRAGTLSEALDWVQRARAGTGASWPGAVVCVVCDLAEDPEFGLAVVGVMAAHQATSALPIVVTTDDADVRIAALRLGATVALPGRVSTAVLAAQVVALSSAAERFSPSNTAAIEGTSAGASLDTVLTVLAMERWCGVLQLSGADSVCIDVVNGCAVHAVMGRVLVDPLTAIVSALATTEGFSFSKLPLVAPTDDAPRLDVLALDAARILDEHRATDPQGLTFVGSAVPHRRERPVMDTDPCVAIFPRESKTLEFDCIH